MFNNIFFLFILLLIIGAGPTSAPIEYFADHLPLTFIFSLFIYGLILLMIILQNVWMFKKKNQEQLLILSNIELVLYFIASYFILGVSRIAYQQLFFPFNDTFLTLYTLSLYFLALFVHHFSAHYKVWGRKDALEKATRAVLFMLPFAFPFLFLITLADGGALIPFDLLKSHLPFAFQPWMDTAFFTLAGLLSLVFTMIFLPPVLIFAWECMPLQNEELSKRFQLICDRAQFKHGGFRIWKAMEGSYNAAIIGIVAKLRYVMFTQKLLNKLKITSLEAILAHEIGHSKYRHLLIYPWILFGMVVTGSIASELINQLVIQNISIFDSEIIKPIVLFITFIAAAAIYFRVVFGYFSRLFERQADLYLFELGIAPESMVDALDEIAHAAGGIHKHPSWHHGSIQERIEFIRMAENDPTIIKRHHRKVKISLLIYSAILIALIAF